MTKLDQKLKQRNGEYPQCILKGINRNQNNTNKVNTNYLALSYAV